MNAMEFLETLKAIINCGKLETETPAIVMYHVCNEINQLQWSDIGRPKTFGGYYVNINGHDLHDESHGYALSQDLCLCKISCTYKNKPYDIRISYNKHVL